MRSDGRASMSLDAAVGPSKSVVSGFYRHVTDRRCEADFPFPTVERQLSSGGPYGRSRYSSFGPLREVFWRQQKASRIHMID